MSRFMTETARTAVEDFVLKTPTFCLHNNVLNIINRVVYDGSDTQITDSFIKNRMLTCMNSLGEFYYYQGTIPFTYVHITDDGELKQVSKTYFRKQILTNFSKDGYLTLSDANTQEKWDYHANFTGTDVQEKARPMKWGTLMKVMCPNMDAKTLSLFCDKLADKTKELMELNWSVQVHDKPSEIYTLESMFASCMVDQDKEKFLIYDDLPSTSIAYIVDDKNVLQARALLHNTTYRRNPIKIMDRIYFRDSYCLAAMRKWAKEHGYWYKTKQSMNWNTFTNKNGEVKEFRSLVLPAAGLEHKYIQLPYIDTFCKLGVDRHGNLCLGVKGSRQNRYIATLQYYNRTHIPNIMLDLEAKYCPECDKLTRRANLRTYLGYNVGTHQDEELALCKVCASKLMLCPVCKKHYIYKHQKWRASKLFLSTGVKNGDEEYRICYSCYQYFKDLQKDRELLIQAGKLPLKFKNTGRLEFTDTTF